MIVKELIEKLVLQPQDALVIRGDSEYSCFEVETIEYLIELEVMTDNLQNPRKIVQNVVVID